MKSISAIFFTVLCATVSAQNVGIGVGVPGYRLHVEGDAGSTIGILGAQVTYSGFADVPAVTGHSVTSDGWGYGGLFTGGFMGINASANAGTYSGTAYGVYGTAFGSDGTRIGVYGTASGGSINWAGYFDGRGRFTDQLVLDESLYASDYLQTLTNVYVGDTVYTQDIYSPFSFQPVRIGAGQDVLLTIDGSNGGYASAFKVTNGLGVDCFGADEFGNAHTFGNHYIDANLGVGTTSPSQKMEVDYGNLLVQGPNSFQSGGDAGIVYLGSIHHYIKGEYGFGVKIGTYAVGDALVIKELSGSVGIGTITPAAGYKLSVDGKIIAEELRVQDSGAWPDFVFDSDYPLMALEDVASAIAEQGHLPGVPSAEEVLESGILVGDMQKLLMQKIEELTLYILQLKAENTQLASRIHQLENAR